MTAENKHKTSNASKETNLRAKSWVPPSWIINTSQSYSARRGVFWRERSKLVKRQGENQETAVENQDESLPSIDDRNWRGIGISLLVIVSISSLIALAILLLSPRGSGDRVNRERFSLADVVSGNFSARKFNGTWVSDTELLFRNIEGHLVIFSVLTRSQKILVPNSKFDEFGVQTYSVSSNLEYVLLAYNAIKVYRHTYLAMYKIYVVSTKKDENLTPPDLEDAHLQYASWGTQGSQLVYVYKNNIFYLSHITDTHHALTGSGIEGIIFNGIPDWLYEEEILSSNNAIWWSNDGNFLCYASFNDSKVDPFYYSWYGEYGDSKNVYPKLLDLHYPKAGQRNPTSSLWIVDLRNSSLVTKVDVKPPREVQDQDHYFTSVQWIENNRLSVIWMRRVQNYSAVTICEGRLWFCHVVHEVSLPHKRGWVDLYDDPIVTNKGNIWFLKLPVPEGNHGTYKHVGMLDISALKQGNRVDFLTQGRYDITKVLGYSEDSNTVFYQSTRENSPGERHLYKVSATRSSEGRSTQCLTCDLGWTCLYNNAFLSPGLQFYVLECLGPGIPRIEVRSLNNITFVVKLDENSDLHDKMEHRASPQNRTFQVPLPGGYKAQVRLFLPPGLVEDEAIQYPMVVQTYGGPGSQLVSERFDVHWGTYLSSRLNYVYAWIDGRGTGFQGDKMQQELYYKLGTVEVEDQLEITRYLRDNLHFIDGQHIAIWGWSYGGYVAASAIADEYNIFKCGVFVAPVTNWLYYNSAYTERYMGSPKSTDNYLEYEKANLLKRGNDFIGRRFLLVHGTADDNVHFQHTMMFVKALKEANVLFQLQVYPDEGHSLRNVKMHLFNTMEEFLKECFYVEPKDELEATRVKKDVKGR